MTIKKKRKFWIKAREQEYKQGKKNVEAIKQREFWNRKYITNI